MNKALDILIAITTNLIGFFAVSICFFVMMAMGIVTEDYFLSQNRLSFNEWASTTMIIWIVCGVFSIAGLFMKQNGRYILILSPAIIPLLYGFSALLLFGGVAESVPTSP
jgi:bacteriorhodopsin